MQPSPPTPAPRASPSPAPAPARVGQKPTVSNSSGTAVNFGSTTAITFSSGVASVSTTKNGVMRLYKSGATNIDVSDGTVSSSPSLAVTVSSLTATKITLAVASTKPVAGEANNADDHRHRHLREHGGRLHRAQKPHLLRRLGEPGRQRAHGQRQHRGRRALQQRNRDRRSMPGSPTSTASRTAS